MKLLTGKAEIIYLLTKVVEKYEIDNGVIIAKNSNRKNYEPIARILSDISNQLPYTAEALKHAAYSLDYNPRNLEYPFRKYDITGNQIKDAYFHQIVSHPRPFLIEACYIYLYRKGRNGFEQEPVDNNLVVSELDTSLSIQSIETAFQSDDKSVWLLKSNKILTILSVVLMIAALFFGLRWANAAKEWDIIKKDMKIMYYKPSQAEVDSLEGVWLCYTGSPQARISDPNRYHQVVSNVVDVKYNNGYFSITRYGASFDHDGYAQFESPWLASIYTYVKNKNNQLESPRHSLMLLNEEGRFKSVISASWNFDVGKKNNIIGIREVYVKQGKGGYIEEIFNTIENASCKCKIIRWHKEKGKIQAFQLKNQLLDSIPQTELRGLLDEKSILMRVPTEGVLLENHNSIN